MASQNRLSQSYLEALAANPQALHSEGFEPLLRYIDANSPMHERIGYSVSLKQDPLRLGQTPVMHFHASAFSEVVQQKASTVYKLKNVYLGMFGINGPLPLHLSEYALERNYRYNDKTLTEFCDIFHHRFLSLFYRSWSVSQPCVSHDHPQHDHFSKAVSTFSGALLKSNKAASNTAASNKANKTPKTAFLHKPANIDSFLSGLFSNKSRSSGTLCQLLSEYLQQEVYVQEFEGDWYALPEGAECRLGGSNVSLGISSVIGERVFQRSYNFSILIGPLTYQNYLLLLNKAHYFKEMRNMVRRHVGSEFSFTFKLRLLKHEIPNCALGKSALGSTAWLTSNQQKSSDETADQLNEKRAIIAYQYAC
ncbi:type VI secretion system baseplate subunit TssG [Ningiella sp. W23]|uniref:type VI secretion system baseplate subunit TssG n=1 Tax=Ningiella sp. W23 TaxID=3023715 RepID=UPI003757850E